MEKYRVDQYNSVYEYDSEAKAYIFIGKLNAGESIEEFIEEYEETI